MKAYKIDVLAQTITEITIRAAHTLEDLRKHIECQIVDCYTAHGVDFWIDDESLLLEPQPHCFQIKDDAILTGNAVVLGHDGEGRSIAPMMPLERLKSLISFIGEHHREPRMELFFPESSNCVITIEEISKMKDSDLLSVSFIDLVKKDQIVRLVKEMEALHPGWSRFMLGHTLNWKPAALAPFTTLSHFITLWLMVVDQYGKREDMENTWKIFANVN